MTSARQSKAGGRGARARLADNVHHGLHGPDLDRRAGAAAGLGSLALAVVLAAGGLLGAVPGAAAAAAATGALVVRVAVGRRPVAQQADAAGGVAAHEADEDLHRAHLHQLVAHPLGVKGAGGIGCGARKRRLMSGDGVGGHAHSEPKSQLHK
jgi:hypothetical protein